ncbi:hypothetical protein BaRGS_00007427, partial [Batillaria attramentaria]
MRTRTITVITSTAFDQRANPATCPIRLNGQRPVLAALSGILVPGEHCFRNGTALSLSPPRRQIPQNFAGPDTYLGSPSILVLPL